MRRAWLAHAPTLAAFLVMVLVAGGLAVALDPYAQPAASRLAAGPAQSIPLPLPAFDQDLDGFHDDVDRWQGNGMLRVELEIDDPENHYFLVGTQDDHWRFGEGRELEWSHVVDPDPLGLKPGSVAWSTQSIRTGTWIQSGELSDSDTTWVAWLDVRDDVVTVQVDLERWRERIGPNDASGQWTVFAGPDNFTLGDQVVPAGDWIQLAPGLAVRLNWGTDVSRDDAQRIADKWAPRIRFDSDEAFYPGDPALMERFHGFAHRVQDMRTWSTGFSNGRDGYRLLLADFDGDRRTDHDDAQLLWDILREGAGSDRIYSHVSRTDADQIALQYWMIYPYNFVIGGDGRDVAALAHAGDREFVQFIFTDLEAALNGAPESVAYSQHYGGIRFDRPDLNEAPFVGGRLEVYPARGSHASYPVPGDDGRLRPAFVGYGDRFNGAGITWEPGEYTVEVMQSQPWHLGYKWGPTTRFHRELGSSGQPLLAHSFVYPWHEPVRWASELTVLEQGQLQSTYGAA